MKCDFVFQHIGEFSRFQWLVVSLVSFCSVLAAMITFSPVFIAPSIDHWCAVSEWTGEVDECWRNDKDLYLECIHKLRNASIIFEEGSYSRCFKYDVVYPSDWREGFAASNYTNVTIPCDEGWVYDRSVYQSSVTMDFDLVCEKENFKEIEVSVAFGGYFVSNFIFGTISDRFGRFKAFYLSSFFVATLGTIVAFSPSFWFFAVSRFLQSCSNMIFGLAFIIGMEFVGPSKRVWAGIIIPLFYPIGYMTLALLAFLIPSWRILQLAIMAHFIFVFLFVCILPESIRWLISKKKYYEAEKVILKVARINKTTDKLPQNFMDEIKREAEMDQQQKENPYVQDLFRTKRLRCNSLNLIYQWCVIALVYFGLSLNTSELGSNDYLAFSLSGAVEIPACFMSLFAIDSFLGRRLSMFASHVIGGIACICTVFIPAGVWRTVAGTIGKFGVTASFVIIYIYTVELFPTPVRSIGTGMCMLFASAASSFSSVILILSDIWEPMPYVIFGSASVVGAFLCLLLPETRGKPLPETMQDGEMGNLASTELENTRGDITKVDTADA